MPDIAAAAYCRWRDSLARLPTEPEWEAAARHTDGRRYPWGLTWETGRANAAGARHGLTPVGSYPTGASPSVALDLAGNAWEWTATEGPTAGGQSQYVIRGGAFDSPREVAAAYYRTALPAAVPERARLDYFGNTGFRCARSVR